MVGSQHALLEPAPTGDVAACSQSARAGARDGALVCKPMYAKNRSITATCFVSSFFVATVPFHGMLKDTPNFNHDPNPGHTMNPPTGLPSFGRAGTGNTQAVCRCDVFMVRDGECTLCAAAQGTI